MVLLEPLSLYSVECGMYMPQRAAISAPTLLYVILSLTRMSFRVLKNATFMLELDGSTIIRKVFVKLDGFIRFPFEMVDYEHLETTDKKYLIGMMQLGMSLMLNGPYSRRQVPRRLTSTQLTPGRLYMSSTSSTLILDDEDIPEIKQLNSDTSGAEFSKELLPVGCSDAKAGTLENLLLWSRNHRHDAATFHCTVRIDNVRTKNGWNFPSCEGEKCRKSVTRSNGCFVCESCNKNVDYPVLRYRLELEVSDDTAEVVVVMFNETASSLVKCTADSIVEYEEHVLSYVRNFFSKYV
uniref:Nucleic acid-binding, OB-fold protein n=1 Tax=Tanacetum cinerariifolium TaxID=118510 RepID=A0A699HVM5_TANCI|nr:nucleic acid-binding, OB-fold protein [Tanacetum cinerariifolium]